MSGNRIRRYESLWTAPAEPGLGQPGLGNAGPGHAGPADGEPPIAYAPGSLNVPPSAASIAHGDVPPGFAVFSLAHLTPAAQQAVYAQRALYQQAYDQARQSADEKFIRDWMI